MNTNKHLFGYVSMLLFIITVVSLPGISLAAGPNLINNPSFETAGTGGLPEGWTKGRWGNNTTVFTYPVAGHNGGSAAEIKVSSWVTGDAKWVFNHVPLTPGKEYRYEDTYKSTTNTYLTVQYKLENGSFMYKDIAQPPASFGWRQFNASFVVPAGVVSGTVFHLLNKNGTLTIDNVVLQVKDVDPTGMVSLAFDDGHKEIFDTALPILNKYGLKSNQYIVTKYLGFPGYITGTQVREMEKMGHEIGAHSRTHRNLTTLSTSEAQSEIVGSRQDLYDLGIHSVATFAYPAGAYNTSVRQMVAHSGMASARSTDGGFNVKGSTDFFVLKRRNMGPESSLAQTKLWIDEAARDKKWLILVFHHIDNTGAPYSVSPEFLESVAAYLVEKSVPVVTISNAVNIFKQ